MQVPRDGSVFAVDFKSVKRIVAPRVAGRFKDPERSIAEPGQKRAGVVDSNFFHFSGQIMFALFDEGFGHRVDFVDAAVEPEGRVNAMRQ